MITFVEHNQNVVITKHICSHNSTSSESVACRGFLLAGLLVFVSSYSLLETFLLRWTETGLLARLNSSKRVCVEPKSVNLSCELNSKFDKTCILLTV